MAVIKKFSIALLFGLANLVSNHAFVVRTCLSASPNVAVLSCQYQSAQSTATSRCCQPMQILPSTTSFSCPTLSSCQQRIKFASFSYDVFKRKIFRRAIWQPFQTSIVCICTPPLWKWRFPSFGTRPWPPSPVTPFFGSPVARTVNRRKSIRQFCRFQRRALTLNTNSAICAPTSTVCWGGFDILRNRRFAGQTITVPFKQEAFLQSAWCVAFPNAHWRQVQSAAADSVEKHDKLRGDCRRYRFDQRHHAGQNIAIEAKPFAFRRRRRGAQRDSVLKNTACPVVIASNARKSRGIGAAFGVKPSRWRMWTAVWYHHQRRPAV